MVFNPGDQKLDVTFDSDTFLVKSSIAFHICLPVLSPSLNYKIPKNKINPCLITFVISASDYSKWWENICLSDEKTIELVEGYVENK